MIKILKDTPDLVVCVKPAGYISEMTETNVPSVPRQLIAEQGYSELYTVHRLDKEVGGVMVYAKSAEAAAALSRQISDKIFDKQYLAEVHGTPANERGVLDDLLFYDRKRNKTYIVGRERKGVKSASLEYALIDRRASSSILQIKLFTGRTHQIRVQLASRKLSILGDKKYGSPDSVKPVRLHSFRLSFNDIKTGERQVFSEFPEWFDDESKIVNM